MKWIYVLIIIAVILTISGWFTLRHYMALVEASQQPNGDLKRQAEIAIKEAAGIGDLGNEAKRILSNYQVGLDWRTNCPAITKLDSLLNSQRGGTDSWVTRDREYLSNLPAHVVIRIGAHAHYEYVWIFDPAHVPLGKIEGVEHLGGAVYLSKKNQ